MTRSGFYLIALVAAVAAAPVTASAAANAQIDACNLLNRDDVEAVTGMRVEEMHEDALENCTQACDAHAGTRCTLSGVRDGTGYVVSLEFGLPPFAVADPLAAGVPRYGPPLSWDRAQRMDVDGLPGRWDFTPGRSVLHVVDGDAVRFLIIDEVTEQDKPVGPLAHADEALRLVEALYARVRQRYLALVKAPGP